MKVLLSVIAVCLVMITAKLYIPEASAEDVYDVVNSGYFEDAVEDIIENCTVYGTARGMSSGSAYIYDVGSYANFDVDMTVNLHNVYIDC